jgi:hypothetical protein
MPGIRHGISMLSSLTETIVAQSLQCKEAQRPTGKLLGPACLPVQGAGRQHAQHSRLQQLDLQSILTKAQAVA